MYTYEKGDLFGSDAQALVNTVNTVGVMGKGIALQFRRRYPEMFKAYELACKAGDVRIGKMWVYRTGSMIGPEYVINFPTKRHWRDKSVIGDIFEGLRDLCGVIIDNDIRSVAIPPLGCGNGGLPWDKVRRVMEDAFQGLPTKRIIVYEPSDQRFSPPPGPKPGLTLPVASIVGLMFQFLELGYENTWFSVQKLAYFLQETGMPLKLRYEKNVYGPYADGLRHLLLKLEGHYIRGMYDGNDLDRFTVIEPLPEVRDEVMAAMRKDEDLASKFDRVKRLIYGFESPYGIELLATVHWTIVHDGKPSEDVSGIVGNIRAWTPRKAAIMTESHVAKARERLVRESYC